MFCIEGLEELTVNLSLLDLLQQGLKPAERGGITTNPEKFDFSEMAKATFLLTVPDVLQNRCEGRNT